MVRGALKRFSGTEQGFTLIELLGVAAILIILSLVTIMNVGAASDRARQAKSQEDLRVIEQALDRHRVEHGHYPRKLTVLQDKGYIDRNFTFENAWGNRYFYAINTDRKDAALAFALGDPGADTDCKSSELRKGTTSPVACGKSLSQYAWVWGHDLKLLDENGQAVPSLPKTLSGFRNDIRTES